MVILATNVMSLETGDGGEAPEPQLLYIWVMCVDAVGGIILRAQRRVNGINKIIQKHAFYITFTYIQLK